jgi:NAD(P)-dependent dehydrogenase (short-subunit alcohol dehydrogenase family)
MMARTQYTNGDLGGGIPRRWDTTYIGDLTGKTAIVTGANSGIGFEIALSLAHKGATVIVACRDEAKATAAMKSIQERAPAARLEFQILDLADLGSVQMFAQRFLAGHRRLDILCNNAGVMALPERRTKDGFEMQIGTNHLGHFALTAHLLPVIERTPGARIVTTSSGFHWLGRIRLEDLNGARAYSPWGAYCQSKLANLMFAFELHRRLRHAGISAASFAAHPGYAATNLQFAGVEMSPTALIKMSGRWMMTLSNGLFAQSASMGALPTLYAATAAQAESGQLIGPRFGLRGHPSMGRAAPLSRNETLARKLWILSEQLVGLRLLTERS